MNHIQEQLSIWLYRIVQPYLFLSKTILLEGVIRKYIRYDERKDRSQYVLIRILKRLKQRKRRKRR